MAAESLHHLAPHHLPSFVSAPGQTDWLFVSMAIFVILAVACIGVFYFRLHALPEHMAHRGQKIQFEIVAVLALVALFTHNHAFWIAALLLALVPLPDFTTPLASMAHSLGRMSRRDGDATAFGPKAEAPDELPPVATSEIETEEALPAVVPVAANKGV